MSSNAQIMERMLRQFAQNQVGKKLYEVATKAAEAIADKIDKWWHAPTGTDDYPIYTGNMRDATGVAVYYNGRMEDYKPFPIATKKQHVGNEITNIVGEEWFQKAVAEGSTKYTDGVWVVLFSAVPYADKVNSLGCECKADGIEPHGVGYFERLEEELIREILAYLDIMEIEVR